LSLPFFYSEEINAFEKHVVLDEENSKHIVQVLRMKEGERLNLTDGRGNLFLSEISEAHKKKCSVQIVEHTKKLSPAKKVCIAVSPVKNTGRFEWFLEKATEMGVSEIVPLLCHRTEKQHFRHDRMKGILVSAMLQSQQVWLPVLHEGIKFEKYIEYIKSGSSQKFIAHCDEQNKTSLRGWLNRSTHQLINSSTILIGPEGDFTKEEIALALENDFIPVALGDTRLRTETAAMVAAAMFCIS